MNEKLQSYLYNKYPKIFEPKKTNIEKAKHPFDVYGFECDDGWFLLINQLANYIQNYIDNNSYLNVPQLKCRQVKEKYGTLRFYYEGGDSHLSSIIDAYENMSGYICEKCGETKEIGNTKGWIKTLCKKHNDTGSHTPVNKEAEDLLNEVLQLSDNRDRNVN
jgi:hypothetical protein